jgi:microcin C transport system substrate-binding protein
MQLGTICRSLLAAGLMLGAFGAQAASHALAMHGEPKYGPDFRHFDYVNPDAPKGGTLRLSAIGTYDNLNNLILKGTAAAGLGYLFDTLTVKADDEPFTQYGLLAETIEVPQDRSWVKFKLRPEARFHDGKPVRPEDVVFTFNTLREKGHPLFRVYWADVVSVEKTGPREVTFRFREGENRELPLIIGEMVVLPEHYWMERDFSQTTLEPPLGSGPYRVAQIDPGRAITFERDPNYWGRDLPVNRGRVNIERSRYD